jgi:hypothetical protein
MPKGRRHHINLGRLITPRGEYYGLYHEGFKKHFDMQTATFNKRTYKVKETGRIIKRGRKFYTDLNGYDTERQNINRKQLGLYDENDRLVYTIAQDGKSIYSGQSKIGEVLIKTI